MADREQDMDRDMGVPHSGSGSHASHGAAEASPPSVSVPNAGRVRPKRWSKRQWKNHKSRQKMRRTPYKGERLYMLYNPDADMPRKLYRARCEAVTAAQSMARLFPGQHFHVLSTWEVWTKREAQGEARQRDPKGDAQ